MIILRAIRWFVRWFPKEKPWLWRPRVYRLPKTEQWRFGFNGYLGWTPDGLKDFNDFGLEWYFGPWTLRTVIADND